MKKVSPKLPQKEDVIVGLRVMAGCIIAGLGICAGVWIGFVVLFVGGICQVIGSCMMDPVNLLGVAIGAIRIMCSGGAGWIIAIGICGVGARMMD